jgi:hypothetical protein
VTRPVRRGRRAAAGLVRLGRVVAGLAIAALLVMVVADPAAAGTFRVSQCNAVDRGGLATRGYQADLWWVAHGWASVDCGTGGGRVAIDTSNHRLPENDSTNARFELPASMDRTSMRTAWLDWTSMPQAWSQNPAYFVLLAHGVRLLEARTGQGTPPGAAQRIGVPAGTRALDFETWCSPVNGPGWCNWPAHMLELRGLTVELEESGEPAAAAGGALMAGGPRSGVEPLEIVASDGDSGVGRVDVTLGGVHVGALQPAGGCRDDRLPPCPQRLAGTVDVDTRRVADGARRLRLVAEDAAGNLRTVDAATVVVANQPPVDTPPGPAPDPGGAAVTSPPAAPPRAPFPPNPLAGRGHVRNGRNASERATVRAWLELDSRSAGRSRDAIRRRRSVTVPPGVRVRIRGRVTDPRGRPIGRATLAGVRREPGGEWTPVTGVRTRPDGRFTAFSRIGPSQELRFVYYAYGDSPRGVSSPRLRVTVRR